jgi:multiple sugar transport system substrate-binding protein
MRKASNIVLALVVIATLLVGCAAPATPAPATPAPAKAAAPAAQPTAVAPAAPKAAEPTKAPAAPVEPTKAAAAPAPSAAAPAPAATGVDWKAYSGASIRVVMARHPIADVAKKLIPDFEKQTGIKVNLESYPEEQMREKLKIEFQAGNKDLDVFQTFLAQEGELYQKAGWYTDLKPYLSNPKFTGADYDWPKDYPVASQNGSQIQGVQVSIPLDRPLPPIVYYRKDLFQQYNIPEPKTLDDIEKAAKTIFEKSDKKIYGIVNRAKASNATSQFANVLHEYGAKWNDETGKPTVNSPEAIAAFDWWGRTLRLYGPPGVLNYDYTQVVNDFLSGNVGISLEGGLNAGVIEDATKSKVVGKVGYLPMLPGPGGGDKVRGNKSTRLLIGLAISNLSTKKDASWLFVQYMTNKEAGLQYLLTGKQSARISAWQDQRFLTTTNPEWAKAMMLAADFNYATQCYAPCTIRDVAQARDISGAIVEAVVQGKDAKAAADKAETDLVALWEKEKTSK